MKSVVVGAGLGGISAALRLRAKGHEVVLVDRLDQLGGRARVFRQDGFTFDAGPTVITAPFLINELFELFGKRQEDYIDIRPVEPWYRFVFNDGSKFDYGGTTEDTLKEIEKFNREDREGYLSLLKESEKIFRIGFEKLGDQPFLTPWSLIREVPRMMRLGAYRSVYQLVKSHLQDDRLRRAFSIQPLLVGGNPFDTTCIYNLIHFLERKWGIHYCLGGTGALVKGLEKLMREEGVEIQLGSDAKAFHGDKQLRSLELASGDEIQADNFVCNADPGFVYQNLLPKKFNRKWRPRRIERLRYSMGLFVIYFGTSRQYHDVKHHTIVMGESYKGILRSIFNEKTLRFDDLSLYLHRPTATDASMAPANNDCFYVLSPVPNLQAGLDWSQIKQKYADTIYQRLEETCLPGLRESLVTQKILSPLEFKTDYCSPHGSGFSVAPLFSQSAYFRFHNRSEDFKNLYFVGAGTHPGAGMPGVLSSSKVLDRLIA